jgi:hypothetical protein
VLDAELEIEVEGGETFLLRPQQGVMAVTRLIGRRVSARIRRGR